MTRRTMRRRDVLTCTLIGLSPLGAALAGAASDADPTKLNGEYIAGTGIPADNFTVGGDAGPRVFIKPRGRDTGQPINLSGATYTVLSGPAASDPTSSWWVFDFQFAPSPFDIAAAPPYLFTLQVDLDPGPGAAFIDLGAPIFDADADPLNSWDDTDGFFVNPVGADPACPGDGACLIPNGTPGCDDPECCEIVCALDTFCCDAAWDDDCAAAAAGQCGSDACPGPGDCFAANGTPGCEDEVCCIQVCSLDPFCCNVEWDAICADGAVTFCGACPGVGDCFAANGTPGCDDAACCELVCIIDPFCCNTEWDALCAGEASTFCTGAWSDIAIDYVISQSWRLDFSFLAGVIVGPGDYDLRVSVEGPGGNQLAEARTTARVVDAAQASLTLDAQAPCVNTGQVVVDVNLNNPQDVIVGAQLFLSYDAARLAFVSAEPGDAPFDEELFEAVDAVAGTIDYAVNVPLGQPGADDSLTIARLTFDTIGLFDALPALVAFRASTPPTRLTDDAGADIEPFTADLGALTSDDAPPTLTLPADVSVSADAGGCDASIDPGVATAADDIDASPSVVGVRDDGRPLTDPYPAGTTVITWTAIDDCGNQASGDQLVTVAGTNELDVAVRLAGVGTGVIERCVTFELERLASACCVPQGVPGCDVPGCEAAVCSVDPFCCNIEWDGLCVGEAEAACADVCPTTVIVTRTLTFVDGLAIDTVDVPCGRDYICASARDELHTLARRDDDDFALVGVGYVADFTESGATDDDALIGGNFNDDGFIDILDFGIFAAQFGLNLGADTPCGAAGPHTDASGDGLVGAADFSFIQTQFLFPAEPSCVGVAAAKGPIASISVADLIAAGQADLVSADLNDDGWLDVLDIEAFAAGARPGCPADLNADGAIDAADLNMVLAAFGASDDAADATGDGAVNAADLNAVLAAFGADCG